MSAIIWKVGNEDSTVVETQGYEESIFYEQYMHACNLIEGFLRGQIEDRLQIVAFCGERGTGKTSCMKSVVKMIEQTQDERLCKHTEEFFHRSKLNNLANILANKNVQFEIPEMIDPSFFDSDNNIIELLIGQIYGDLLEFEKKHKGNIDRLCLNNIYDSLGEVKECLLIMHGTDGGGFSRSAELSVLSSAVSLKKVIRKLINQYLKLKGKNILLITIDDLDLNRDGTYEMCEQVRKYLAIPECVVFMSFNYMQLLDSIQGAFRSSSNDQYHEKEAHLAVRYVDKLVASRERVHMPTAYNLCNRELRIYEDGKRKIIPGGEKIVKDVVVSLIFQKTRFLFYNSKGGISPILPNNLRDLLQLLGMLWSLPELPNKETEERRDVLEFNKGEFKNYFYRYWTKNLKAQHRKMVEEIVNNTPSNILNQTLVRWLRKEFKNELDRNYDTENEDDIESNKSPVKNLMDYITSDTTFSYNVSVGDLFYLINRLQQDTLSPEKEQLLFFIRSYYSILLYEAYDIVTEGNGERYPEANNGGGIYTVDRRFNHTNELQRIVNGGFFTYHPGELLPNSGTKDGDRVDMCILKAEDGVRNIFSKIHHLMQEYDRYKEKLRMYEEVEKGNLRMISKEIAESEDDYQRRVENLKAIIPTERLKLIDKIRLAEKWFKTGEFIVMTVSRAIPQKELTKFNDGKDTFRENVRPYSLWPFNMSTGYFVMDVMYPFYALVNPQFAYGRFDLLSGHEDDTNCMYTFALKHDFSLLRKMMSQVMGYEVTDAEVDNPQKLNDIMWRLQSDAMIRNGEVLMAVFENAVEKRFDKYRTGSRIDKWINLYHGIGASGLTTHKTAPNEQPYKIDFRFLQPLAYFLKNDLQEITNDTDSSEYQEALNEWRTIFDNMFDLGKNQNDRNDIKEQSKQKMVSIDTSSKGNKSSADLGKNIKINPFLKANLIKELEKILGNEPLTASQIHDNLRAKYPVLKGLTYKDMRQYVSKKPHDWPYAIENLAEHILKNKERQQLWGSLIGIKIDN